MDGWMELQTSRGLYRGLKLLWPLEDFNRVYIITTLTDQNYNQEEIKSRLKSGNACCRSVQNRMSSSLLPKNIKIKI